MTINKQEIITNLCYTELVYGRINKKLKTNYSKSEIDDLMKRVLEETDEKHFTKLGKNYYIINSDLNIRITINSNTFRVITVDKFNKKKI